MNLALYFRLVRDYGAIGAMYRYPAFKDIWG